MVKYRIVIYKFFLCYLVFLNQNSIAQESLKTTRPTIFSKPEELNWRSINWSSTNYSRVPVDGGAALYVLPSSTALKFKINFVFEGDVYALKRDERPAFGALVDLLVLGGFGNLNYDEIQNYTNEYGIQLRSAISPEGKLVITANALTTDFSKVMDLISNLLLKPRFEANALPLWKQQANDAFINLLNANTYEKQNRFLEQEINILAFGKEHYFASFLKRTSPSIINAISYDEVKKIYKQVLNKNGLNVSIAGNFSMKDLETLKNLIVLIPSIEPEVHAWLPERKMIESEKIRTKVILKPDMTQCNVVLRYYFPNLGELNSIERMQFSILSEIFSSTGGVVGRDRFSKALRRNSGISYSPHAYFNERVLFPNTNVGAFNLSFQSPNERIPEAVKLAIGTWKEFLQQGISQDELDNTRTALMNRMLASELTVFDKSDDFMSFIIKGWLPSPNPIYSDLVKLDKQRDFKQLNETLQSFAKEKMIPVLAIMGNPTKEQITQLKEISDLDLLEVKDLNEYTSTLL